MMRGPTAVARRIALPEAPFAEWKQDMNEILSSEPHRQMLD